MVMLRRFLLAVAALAAARLETSLDAGVIGSQGFSVGFVVPDSGSLDQALALSSVTSNSNQSGDFSGLSVGTLWGDLNLGAFTTAGSTISLTSLDFGTFTGTIVGDTGEFSVGVGFSRALSATGTWTPGSNAIFGGDTSTMNNSNLSITLTKSSAGSTIGAAIVLDTSTSTTHIGSTPEPSSLVLAGIGVCGLAYRVYRRRK